MKILGIESTCDETGVAVVANGTKVISNIVASSINLQKKYGGVVPEVAAREQIQLIIPTIDRALARVQINDIDAIAVSYGPGLIGSLLVGVETAKALAIAWDKPLIAVNHLVGHIYANWIKVDVGSGDKNEGKEGKSPNFPLIALVVSGGHTDLVLMKGSSDFQLLGSTLDDSAGEAFDKVARLLGLGYPGGPEIERLANTLNSDEVNKSIKLPRPMISSGDYSFSFSGLKTAVVNFVNSSQYDDGNRVEVASEFQRAVVDVLVSKTIKAAVEFDCHSIVIGGGVIANTLLRSQMADSSSRIGKRLFVPSKKLAVDNGAMIAAAAYYRNIKVNPLKLQADPSLHF